MVAIKIKNNGFTLIELLVAVTVFSLVAAAVSEIFIFSIRNQRNFLSGQEIVDQSSYLMEYVSRALRMAKKDVAGNCLTAAGMNFNYETDGAHGNRLRFLNYQNQCQELFLEGAELKERKSLDGTAANFQTPLILTSANLQVLSFNIGPSDSWSQDDSLQPKVTLFLEIQGKEQSSVKIQTTVSQRNPDIQL